jgi:hypothetical protein
MALARGIQGIAIRIARAVNRALGRHGKVFAVHLTSDHVCAAHGTGWRLAEMHEQVIDDRWVETKTSWAAYRDCPISFAFVWRRDSIEPCG